MSADNKEMRKRRERVREKEREEYNTQSQILLKFDSCV